MSLLTNWWTRGLIAAVVLILIAIIGFRVFQVPIMSRVFDAAMESRMTADPLAELSDGLHVYLCGTGSPIADDRRAASCVGVVAGDQAFVFDAGSGGIRKLGRMGFPMGALESAFLTHLHSDHIDGLGELLVMAWIGDNAFRSEPLPVRGPVGTATVVEAFNTAYAFDRNYRVAHHSGTANPDGYGGRPIELELPAGPAVSEIVYEQAGVTIRAIRVDHSPVEPAFGYRIDYGGRSVSLSGDTIYHPGFVRASEGVDVMLHEGLDPDMVQRLAERMETIGRDVPATLLYDILDYHASPEDAARAASEAGAEELVFYHIVPPLPMRALNRMWLGESGNLFDGRITVGEDGMLISLPANSDEIIHTNPL
ncbi:MULTISPECIES: MBL fold metallo-hydrolase [Hyphobacterium]|uniref:MBL fold metallo-hydrolase n=1 Tax=Hyphobacterium vulgare TaxID=1736751 RepID=A0ABV7A0S0_9PROT